MNYIQFESARDKEKARNELREAREEMLERAKQNAEKRAERKAQAQLKGETNWMLPTVAAKFEKSESKKKLKHSKKSKKSKKPKKSSHKKLSKRRHNSSSSSDSGDSEDERSNESTKKIKKGKKKRRRQEYSSSSSNDSSNSDNECSKDEWIEKPQSEPKVARENWMTDSDAFSLKTFSSNRNEPKEKDIKPAAYDPTKSARELNPHWKTTGTGLPKFQKPKDNSDDEMNKHEKPTDRSSFNATSGSKGSWRKKSNTIQKQAAQNSTESSSSTSDDEEMEASGIKEHQSEFLTDQQMNELGAKLLKAEILGNMDLANELKEKLEKARVQRATFKDGSKPNAQTIRDSSKKHKRQLNHHENEEEHVLLTHTDKMGNSRPLKQSTTAGNLDPRELYGGRSGRRKAGKRVETHVDGARVRYFPDDDKYDIKQMFEREKYTTPAESNLQFADIASKHKNPNDDLDDIFTDKVRQTTSTGKDNQKELQRAIREHEKLNAQLEKCDKCFDSEKMNKSLIVSMGEKAYLALPYHIGLQVGHCLIIPTQHATCCTQLDEDTWEEIENFRKALTRMFQAQRRDVVFFEIANKLHKRTHLTIHCVPMPMSQGELAPFYFKKAIEESEQEWSVNKQLVSLRRDKGLRNSIPKGLPYFWVNFGMDSGFAHVIEDENRFPSNFALEIIGGLLHLDPAKWRKPQKEQNVIHKVRMLADIWKKYDCTQ